MIYCDNQGAIALSKNPGEGHGCSKHIDIQDFFVQERVGIGDVQLKYVRIDD